MKAVLINPNCNFATGTNTATIEPPIGIAYLASFLDKNGYQVKLIDSNILKLSDRQTVSQIDSDTDLIGISSNIVSAAFVPKLVKKIRKRFSKIPLIAGGPYPSALPEICLKEFGFDGVCIGEGEETLLEIMNNLKKGTHLFKGVNGVAYLDKKKMIINEPRELVKDLDSLPFPKLELLPDLRLYKSRARGTPVGIILSSRGCPYGCIYCNKNIFRRIYRSRSVDNIIREIEQQIKLFDIKQIDFLDDNLTFNMLKAEQLFDTVIKKKFNLFINMQNGVRADRINEKLVKKMKKAGVFKVSLGVESGDEQVQRKIDKNLDLSKAIEATRLFKKYHIEVYGNFMFGLPTDTAESMQKTIDFAKKMNPNIANFMITIPLPGTDLYQQVKDRGVFFVNNERGMTRGFYGGRVYYSLPGIETDKVIYYYRKAYLSFYLRPFKIIEIILGCENLNEIKWLIQAGLATLQPLFKISA